MKWIKKDINGLNPIRVIVMCALCCMFRMVLETDANVIAGKVAMQSAETSSSLSEQVWCSMTFFEQSDSLHSDYYASDNSSAFWIVDINSSIRNGARAPGKKSFNMIFIVEAKWSLIMSFNSHIWNCCCSLEMSACLLKYLLTDFLTNRLLISFPSWIWIYYFCCWLPILPYYILFFLRIIL